jgi:hypothetical protein
MNKYLLILTFVLTGMLTHAQEKNGTVFIQHPSIEKTKKLWSAFEKGDKVACEALLADTMIAIYNGNRTPQKKAAYIKGFDWGFADFDNLKVRDDAPAYPDAIEYTKGGLWVQDWLVMTGTHKKSGINLELHLHNLYQFNKDGKIASVFLYFDQKQFMDIDASDKTQENGKIFINHPYIVTVRKLVNAYCAMDVKAMAEFYSKDARFYNSTMKMGESMDLAARIKASEATFANSENIRMRQFGYPDCMYYSKEDNYVVYSWWILTSTQKAGGKKIELPIMLSHTFNKDGKIVDEMAFYSSNHLQ